MHGAMPTPRIAGARIAFYARDCVDGVAVTPLLAASTMIGDHLPLRVS